MRRTFSRNDRFKKPLEKEFRVNEKIFAPVVVIIDEDNQNLGQMNRAQALQLATEKELDLVEVSPKTAPPICKILNYGSFKYQREKQERKQKAKHKESETKTIKLSLRISQHDLDFRANQAAKFLTNKDKVKIEMQLRGRENQHADLAKEVIGKTLEKIKVALDNKELKIEQEIKKLGNRLSTILFIN